MQPFELPRHRARRALAVRGHFHQPRSRVASRVNPFRVDWSRVWTAAAVGLVVVLAVVL